MRLLRNGEVGISPLKSNGLIYTDSKDKAEILNAQFKSVFMQLKKSITPSISGKKYSAVGKLNISLNGVTKLL